MKTLTYGEEQWLSLQMSDAMHKLGIEVTPETMTREAQRRDAMLRAASAKEDYTPPNPYDAGISKMRAGGAPPEAPKEPKAPPPPPTDYSSPDPYAKAIADLKRSEQR